MIYTKWINGDGDIADALALRFEVFVDEQRTPPEEELDGLDQGALHLVVYDGDEPIAAGRIIDAGDGVCMLGRICVKLTRRGEGIGDFAVRAMIRKACDMGFRGQLLHAQVQALGFYEKLGFKAYGEQYMEAGIPHVSMRREGDVSGKC